MAVTTRFRITIRMPAMELRGYIDGLPLVQRVARDLAPLALVIASPADDDYQPFAEGDNHTGPLDVWLAFDEDNDDDEEASHEANVYLTRDFRFDVQWYHTAVGLVTHEYFDTYAEAQSWLERSGYRDFSS